VYAEALKKFGHGGPDTFGQAPEQAAEAYMQNPEAYEQDLRRQHQQNNELVQVMGPNGPQYVPQSQAAGMAPYSNTAQAKPSAIIAAYEQYRSQGGTKPFVDPEGKGNDFVTQFARSQVGAQYGAPTDVPGQGVVVPSRTTGELNVISPEAEVAQAQAVRAGQTRGATDTAAANVDIQQSAPQEIASLEESITRNRNMLADLEAGKHQTGFFAGKMPAITENQQLFDVFTGEDVLQKISSATFGALSEGEREFLRQTVPSRDLSESANMSIIKRRLEILDRAMAMEKRRLENATGPVIDVRPSQTREGSASDPLGIR
jgi:hypothetical protein